MSNVIDFMRYKNKESYSSRNMKNHVNKLYILIGIPCSGKSTYANKNFNDPNTVIVSTDEIRRELTGTYRFSQKTNNRVFEIAKVEIPTWLGKGYDVVFDATKTNKKYRKTFIGIGIKNEAQIIGIVFNTPIKLCLTRNSMRDSERKVPEEIIVKMSNFNSELDASEGFDEVIFIGKS